MMIKNRERQEKNANKNKVRNKICWLKNPFHTINLHLNTLLLI